MHLPPGHGLPVPRRRDGVMSGEEGDRTSIDHLREPGQVCERVLPGSVTMACWRGTVNAGPGLNSLSSGITIPEILRVGNMDCDGHIGIFSSIFVGARAARFILRVPNGHAICVDAGDSWAAQTITGNLDAERITWTVYVVAAQDRGDHRNDMMPSSRQ